MSIDKETATWIVNGLVEHEKRSGESPALLGAFRKGAHAAFSGVACPYPDHRTGRGSITFSRSFRRAWFRGLAKAQHKINEMEDGDVRES